MFVILMGCHVGKDLASPSYIIHGSHPTPVYIIPVYIDDNFTSKDKESIKIAINNWNESLCGYLVLKVVSIEYKGDQKIIELAQRGRVYLILKTYSSNPIISSRDHGTYVTLGLANNVGGNWLWIVRDRIGDIDVTPITMHELGHLLGAEHAGGHLMHPDYSKIHYQCIDKATTDQVASRWHLPANKLNYCVYN